MILWDILCSPFCKKKWTFWYLMISNNLGTKVLAYQFSKNTVDCWCLNSCSRCRHAKNLNYAITFLFNGIFCSCLYVPFSVLHCDLDLCDDIFRDQISKQKWAFASTCKTSSCIIMAGKRAHKWYNFLSSQFPNIVQYSNMVKVSCWRKWQMVHGSV